MHPQNLSKIGFQTKLSSDLYYLNINNVSDYILGFAVLLKLFKTF